MALWEAAPYPWSFHWGTFAREEVAGPVFGGIAADPRASQELRNSFSRLVAPSEVLSRERLARWFGIAPAEAITA